MAQAIAENLQKPDSTNNPFLHITTNPPLNLEPMPTLEGLNNTKVETKIKPIDLGQTGIALQEYLKGGSEESNIYLFEISSDLPYWLDYMSSMGYNSREMLKHWIESTMLSPYIKDDTKPELIEAPSLLASFFGGATNKGLQEGTAAMGNFIATLLGKYQDSSPVDRPFYATSIKLCPFSQLSFSFIIVDPEPHSGPDKLSYLIVIENLYTE